MALTKAQKLEALSEFLETRAQAKIDGHSAQDGTDCPAHDTAFEWLANELLELVEDNYGYAEETAEPKTEVLLKDYIEYLQGQKADALASGISNWVLSATNELTRAEGFAATATPLAENTDEDDPDQHLWEILVPTVRNDGRPFKLKYHRVWDERVKAVSGGLTIVSPVNGVWVSPTNETFKERMIPVRIMCTREEILAIAEMSKVYYEQEAIMVFRISREVYIVS